MARVSFYDPYLDVLGGGEKVLLTILESVASSGRHEVVIMSPRRPDPAHWGRLNISVDPAHLRWRAANQLSVTALSAGMDLFVTLTNHFPPLSLARRSATIVQFPFARLAGSGSLDRLRAGERAWRLRSYDHVVCYSEFVAAEIRERLRVAHPLVLTPPVDLPSSPSRCEKERKVIAVGRFFPAADANNKKHEVLIDAWRALERSGRSAGWELHLVGGLASDSASVNHFNGLVDRGRGLSIQFHPNAEPDTLVDLYRRSAVFWHAAGFGEALPERYEHFGITTVEAMAYGCVPVVVGLGGQLEIVSDEQNGRLWRSIDELVAMTSELIADPARAARLRSRAIADAARYGKAHFVAEVSREVLVPAGIADD